MGQPLPLLLIVAFSCLVLAVPLCGYCSVHELHNSEGNLQSWWIKIDSCGLSSLPPRFALRFRKDSPFHTHAAAQGARVVALRGGQGPGYGRNIRPRYDTEEAPEEEQDGGPPRKRSAADAKNRHSSVFLQDAAARAANSVDVSSIGSEKTSGRSAEDILQGAVDREKEHKRTRATGSTFHRAPQSLCDVRN